MIKNAGFTLIEVIIVIALISITLTLMTPNLTAWAGNEAFNSSAENVKSVIQRAKIAAINEHCKVVVKFSLGYGSSGTYYAFIDDDGGTTGEYDTGETVVISKKTMPDDVELNNVDFNGSLEFATRFNSMGIPVGYDGIVTLKNEDVSPAYRRIVVSAAGNIKMEKSTDGDVWSS